MSRNFGIRSRSLRRAGIMVLYESSASFESKRTNASRWNKFAQWEVHREVNRMEHITVDDILTYGRELAEDVSDGRMALSTAHNLIAVVNRVLELARGDRRVRATAVRDCGLPRRTGIAQSSKAITETEHQTICAHLPPHVATIRELGRHFGGRFKECALLDLKKALKMALDKGWVLIRRGTKGGQARMVPITSEKQLAVLKLAAGMQVGRCLVPPCMTYAAFRRHCYQINSHFHRERHSYAHRRYEELTLAQCPVIAGRKHGKDHFRYLGEQLGITVHEARLLDHRVREKVSKELGHHRKGITNAYYG